MEKRVRRRQDKTVLAFLDRQNEINSAEKISRF